MLPLHLIIVELLGVLLLLHYFSLYFLQSPLYVYKVVWVLNLLESLSQLLVLSLDISECFICVGQFLVCCLDPRVARALLENAVGCNSLDNS